MPIFVLPEDTGAVVGGAAGAVVGGAAGAVVGGAAGCAGAGVGAGVGVLHAAKIIDKTAMIVTIISERFILRFITFLLD